MTFNNFYTHQRLPAVFKKKNNIDAFYQNVLLNPDNLHGFLVNTIELAAKNANEDVEAPFDNSEHFYLGKWVIGCDDISHNNWGEITPATHDEFLQKLYKLVYNQYIY